MLLVAHKSEVASKGHDEILHVVDDGILDLPFVHVRLVAFADFLHIDEIQQILVLEHLSSAFKADRLSGIAFPKLFGNFA